MFLNHVAIIPNPVTMLLTPAHSDPRIQAGFLTYMSDDVVLSNVVVYQCSNECFTSEHAERHIIANCQCKKCNAVITKPSAMQSVYVYIHGHGHRESTGSVHRTPCDLWYLHFFSLCVTLKGVYLAVTA